MKTKSFHSRVKGTFLMHHSRRLACRLLPPRGIHARLAAELSFLFPAASSLGRASNGGGSFLNLAAQAEHPEDVGLRA